MISNGSDIAKQLCLSWARRGPDEPLLASEDFTKLTLDSESPLPCNHQNKNFGRLNRTTAIALCAMGYRFNSFYREETHPFVKAMVFTLTEASRRRLRPAFVTKMMTGTNAQLQADRELQKSVGEEIVNKRRAEGGTTDHHDLLDNMIHGKDPATGRTMDDSLISANMQTFLVAGTTSTRPIPSRTSLHFHTCRIID